MDLVASLDVLDNLDSVETIHGNRIVRDRSNPMEEYDDAEFLDRYRFNKSAIMLLLNEINDDLIYTSQRNNFVPPILQLLVAIRFYATGHFQRSDGDLIGIEQSTAGRIIHRVSTSIARKKHRFISFPMGEDLRKTKQAFFQVAGFPNVVGAIDCTHIPIISPGGDNAEIYRNRKGYFSLNVQAVCDSQLRITNIVCRWPGSTHDSRIFDNSTLCFKFESDCMDGLLLGDGGYACRRYLMTPLLNPVTQKEKNYNRAQIATRIKVERTFGVWKQCFRCLRIPLRTKLCNTLTIIIATACLHNYAVKVREVSEYIANSDDSQDPNDIDSQSGESNIAGNALRQQIVSQYF